MSKVRFAYQPGGPYPSHCGYCHGADERFFLEGVWSERMTAQDFQDLVDRGCQRSGKFVYLPTNHLTCCPQYVFRVDARTFKVSKEQRRVVRRVSSYLLNGKEEQGPRTGADTLPTQLSNPEEFVESVPEGKEKEEMNDGGGSAAALQKMKKRKMVTPGKGPDPDRPPCRKAKDIRRAKKEQKVAAREKTAMEIEHHPKAPVCQGAASNMIEVVRLPDPLLCKHKFETKLICINPLSKEFWNTYEESYDVFRKFQMTIHKDPPEKCDKRQFYDFIVDSPLFAEESMPGTGLHYGSFHLQYWIDGKLLMVGVLDIIPKGVLCNYLYYDPDMRFLAPGVYSALREIALTQELCQRNPSLQYYYMGYYVHDCPKMNYKRHYNSAYLLCLETYDYVPLAACRKKLDVAKVCRFSDSTKPRETFTDEDVEDVLVVCQERRCRYRDYRAKEGGRYNDLVSKYLTMVGRDLAKRMNLHLQLLPIAELL